jgi:hypothetical protein
VTTVHTTLDSSFRRDAHGIVVPDAIEVAAGTRQPRTQASLMHPRFEDL